MKYFKSIFLLFVLLLFVGCSSKNEYYNSHKKFIDMTSYKADATIKVKGNKSTSEYKVKQTVKDPEMVKIETIEPKELKGKVIAHYNDEWNVYHPLIEDIVKFEDLRDIEEIIYMGIIQKSFIMSQDVKEKPVVKNGKKCIELTATLPNGNDYRSYAKLYISEGKFEPLFLEIYSKDDNISMEVEYSKFEYNPKIDDKEFILKK